MEGEITLTELNHALFKKMKGSSAPGIDGFTVNWLRKFWDSLKMVTLNSINSATKMELLPLLLKQALSVC